MKAAQEKEKEKEAAKTQEEKTAKVRLNDDQRQGIRNKGKMNKIKFRFQGENCESFVKEAELRNSINRRQN